MLLLIRVCGGFLQAVEGENVRDGEEKNEGGIKRRRPASRSRSRSVSDDWSSSERASASRRGGRGGAVCLYDSRLGFYCVCVRALCVFARPPRVSAKSFVRRWPRYTIGMNRKVAVNVQRVNGVGWGRDKPRTVTCGVW